MLIDNKNFLVSIIIPVYNTEKFLCECLDTVLNQTYKNLEIILIDDGSIDNSGKICDEYAKIDNRIKVIHQNNQGVSAARNRGICIAKGEWITFVDSDDLIELDYIEVVVKYLQKYSPDILLNSVKRDNIKECELINFKPLIFNKQEALMELVKGTLFHWGPYASFYNSQICKKNKFEPQISYGEDLLFKYNFIKTCNSIVYLPLIKYFYAYREDSACNSYNLYKKIDDLKVLRFIIKEEKKGSVISKTLFYNEFIPRLITYVIQAAKSDDLQDKEIRKLLQKKIKRILFLNLTNYNISLSNKIKMFICLFPDIVIINANKIFEIIKKLG